VVGGLEANICGRHRFCTQNINKFHEKKITWMNVLVLGYF
jgi:hypothetical protein